jgi:FkbM family methyltransferase
MKRFLLRQIRRRALQPMWDRLAHLALLGRNYWATQPEESGEYAVLRQLRPKVVFDAGANIGDYAREASKYGKVYAFEPSHVAFQKLKSVPGIEAFNLALGDEEGTATLHGSGTTASLIGDGAGEAVKVATLDGIWNEHIDLLKIDVEGYELAVIVGAKRLIAEGKVAAIQFEHGVGSTPLKAFFDALPGYEFYRVVSDGLWKVAYSPELEIAAPINYLARALAAAS